jgi:hypothetical protein
MTRDPAEATSRQRIAGTVLLLALFCAAAAVGR